METWELHDCGNVKYDFLVTEIQDVIVQCLKLLQENNEIEQNLTLRELYNKYLHPEVLPIKDNKIWEALATGSVLKCFQFDSMVGGQTVKTVRPSNPIEMSNCNSAMRLVAVEKSGETPTERIVRMKNNINEWYQEMEEYNLTKEEQKILEPYYLPTNAMPAQQEDMMRILMDKNICNFSLAEANAAKKICAKKLMDQIETLHQKVLNQATSLQLGKYVWDTALRPQMSYSFSLIHSLAYSFIGLQTIYLATYFNPIYWNTACLRVDSGLEDNDSSNYGKIAKAVGNIINRNINISLIDINKSDYMFTPDIENDTILYGMKAISGVNGEIIQEIVKNRPYNSLQDFMNKVKCKKTVMISLIKSGAFDQFGDRKDIMREYIWSICEPKKRITMQNFNGLNERNLLPAQLNFEKRVFNFNKAVKKVCKIDGVLVLKDQFYDFYEQYFDVDELEPYGDTVCITEAKWKKQYDKAMLTAKKYLTEHKIELLEQLNSTLFQEMWDKYAIGNYSSWEMDSLGFYYHAHELAAIDKSMYNIVEYKSLPDEPVVDYTFKRNDIEIPIFKTQRIMGTVIAKDDIKSCISILTPESGVVTVKFSRDYYAKYNRQISEIQPDGTKKVREKGWFTKGTLVVVNGFKRSDMYVAKTYKQTKSHQLYRITKIYSNGTLEMTNDRYGDGIE